MRELFFSKILKEEFDKLECKKIIFQDAYFHIFKNDYKSFHGRIEDGLIACFYLKEFLKYYNLEDLENISSWEEFVSAVTKIWSVKSPSTPIVYRRGKLSDSEMFFSDNISVASVYLGSLNAYHIMLKNPYIIDCKGSDWDNILEPKIMKGESYDGTVTTDSVVEFIKKQHSQKYDGVVFLNIYEGSGASVFGESNIYVTFNSKNVNPLTNN